MKKTKLAAGMIVMALTASLFAGCGGNSNASSASSEASAAAADSSGPEAPEAPAEKEKPAATKAPEKEKTVTEAQDAAAEVGEITAEEAKAIALKDAGFKEADVVFKKDVLDVESDSDDVPHYDVDFYAADTEYEYDIDPVTGDILKVDTDVMDAEDYAEMEALQGQAAKAASGEAAGIDADRALDIALADAGVSADDAYNVKSQLDYEDDLGREVFEVEFKVGSMEYNYDIDPDTGEILFSESEIDD